MKLHWKKALRLDDMAETYSEPRLILCEGDSDNAFFRHLMERRVIAGFQVIEAAKGNTGFETRLRSIRANPGFPNLKAILIVSDHDNDRKARFKLVTDQIAAAGGYGIPGKRQTAKKATGHPAIVVLMLPWRTRTGCLETIIADAILSCHPEVKDCIDAYGICTATNLWDKSKRDKMRLHSMLSAVCVDDPAVSPSWMWKPEKGLQDLLDDPAFDQLADFLTNFPVA